MHMIWHNFTACVHYIRYLWNDCLLGHKALQLQTISVGLARSGSCTSSKRCHLSTVCCSTYLSVC